jgi:lipopolysaccharide/colanic/teichoic acid biosynthesis glycosyltransferase
MCYKHFIVSVGAYPIAMDASRKDLFSLAAPDAWQHRRRASREFRAAALPISVAAMGQAAVYTATMVGAGRQDWVNIAACCLMLALTPLASSLVLFSMRRLDFPITAGLLLGAFVFNLAVAVLSAFRVPVSYTGLLMAAPLAVCAAAWVALRLRSGEHDRVAVLPFPGADALVRKLGQNAFLFRDEQSCQSADRVLIDGRTHHNSQWSPLLMRLHMNGVETCPWPYFTELRFGRVELESSDFSDIAYSPSQLVYLQLKRILDIAIVLATGPFFFAAGLLIAGYIFLMDGGPIFFQQRRRGYGGSEFTILKFRTMIDSPDSSSTSENDSRIIPGCSLVRRLRLDEIPQLINILRGEMSWIGPRPTEISVTKRLEIRVPQYRYRYAIRPGLSGWAQVSYGYAGTDDEEIEKLAYDLYYLKRVSFDLDVLIFVKTVRTVLMRAGAR